MAKLARLAPMLLILLLVGCANQSKPQTLPPGALNSFDANSYVTLMGIQAALNSAKADYEAGRYPQSPQAKQALNAAISAYNVAEAAWQAEHAGTGNPSAVTTAAMQATTAVVNFITIVTGGK